MISSLLLRSATVLGFLGGAFAQQTYQLDTEYSGASFFDEWEFWTGTDPTQGFVTYVDQNTANQEGLTYVDGNGVAHIGVDTTSVLNPSGAGRESVRITTQKQYTHGLIISDISNMPGGVCGTWPAFWSFGPDWPNSGEIDIIEGVNSQSTNLMSLHLGGTCSVAGDQQRGKLQTANCNQAAGFGSGCGALDTETTSYGLGFNANGGGVFATQWTSDFIRIWFFPANSIPADITNGTPNPDVSVWGLPASNFEGSCNIDTNFKNHNIVFDTTFCGQWGGSVWASDPVCKNLAPTCEEYVALNPHAFNEMFWAVKSVKVYQLQDAPSVPTTPTSLPTSMPTGAETPVSPTELPSSTSQSSTTTTSLSSSTEAPTTASLFSSISTGSPTSSSSDSATATTALPTSTTSHATGSSPVASSSSTNTTSTLKTSSSIPTIYTTDSGSGPSNFSSSTSGSVPPKFSAGTFTNISLPVKATSITKSGFEPVPVLHNSSDHDASNYSGSSFAPSTTLSTILSTHIYPVTSCAPTVINCPARLGRVTTEIISIHTTVCPITASETPALTCMTPQSSVFGFGKGGSATIAYALTTSTALTYVAGFPTTVPVIAPAVTITSSPTMGSGGSGNVAVLPTKGASGAVQTSFVTIVPVATPIYQYPYPAGNSTSTALRSSGTAVVPGVSYSGVSVSGAAAQLDLTRLDMIAGIGAFVGALILL